MIRLSFLLCFSVYLLAGELKAQNTGQLPERRTVQELSPAEAQQQQQMENAARFAYKLSDLKKAFSEKDVARIIAQESYLLNAIRMEADRLAAIQDASSGMAIEKLNATLKAFEGNTLDVGRPEAAARHFALLEDCLQMMQGTKP